MFCDLVDSTKLSVRLDPEDLRDLTRAYREACSQVVRRYDGYIARYLGDGLLVYFGYPIAHEDDAQRAVRTGLGVVEAIEALRGTLEVLDVHLAVRIGIHTGLVVAGDIIAGDQREERAIVGETPNLAARLQTLAEPNGVIISATTKRLVDTLFVFENLGPRPLKGISIPMNVFRVLSELDENGRYDISTIRRMTPLIGRSEEIGLLLNRWKLANEADGQVVLLSGEPGIGKSRILKGFQSCLISERWHRVLYHCSPYHQNSALYPAIDYILRGLRFDKQDSPHRKLEKLKAALRDLGLPMAKFLPAFASLLSLPMNGPSPSISETPQQLRKMALEGCIAAIQALAKQAPVMMLVEDAQWMDPSTLELLNLMIEQLRRSRILLVVTFRPEFKPAWGEHTHVTALRLNRLGRRETVAMATEVSHGKTLPEEILQQIIEKTDGVPLFIEELTKAVLESGLLQDAGDHYRLSGPLPPLAIPTSLHDSLTARLDRLLPVKQVAQLAAAMGRSFSRELLAALSPLDDNQLDSALAELVSAGLMHKRGVAPGVTYEFKHALVRDAAYQSLLRSTRQQYHHRIAQVLESQFSETVKTQPELLAHHYTEAGLTAQAVAYWRRAGQLASERSANLEAIAHLSMGLQLLKTLPDTLERQQYELSLLIDLNGPVIASKGYSAPELERNFTRALDLCRQIGETAQIFPVLYAKWVFQITTGNLTEGYDLALEFLQYAERQDDVFRMIGHRILGPASFIVGKFEPARRHLEEAIALYDPHKHRPLTTLYGQDVGVACQCYLALTLWHLGYAEKALSHGHEALARAKGLVHAHTLGNALGHVGAFLHLLCRRGRKAQRYAKSLLRYAEAHALPVWTAAGHFYLGWSWLQDNRYDDAISSMQKGLEGLKIINFVYWRPLILSCLGEAYGKIDRPELATSCLDEAQAIIERGGEHWFEAEMLRIKGELLCSMSPSRAGDAESCFAASLAVARAQGAKSWELRTTMSIVRLRQKQGRVAEAKAQLSDVYKMFTEGLADPDLVEAKAVLDDLG